MKACGEFVSNVDGIYVCGYCGSITAEDAIKFLKTPGTMFSGSDWKYGWPHKFYIEVLNPRANIDVEIGCGTIRTDGTPADGTGENEHWECYAHGRLKCTCPKEKATGYWCVIHLGKKLTVHYKFYNKHLETVSDDVFKEFSELSLKVFGIQWAREGKQLTYSAPKTGSPYGFQLYGRIQEKGKVDYGYQHDNWLR